MDAITQGIINNLNFWSFFLTLVLADLLALLAFWVCLESSKTNILFFRRMTKWRFNCLAILYEEFKAQRLNGLSQEAALKEIKKKYKNNSLSFMLHPAGVEDIAFIGELLNNEEVFFRFVDTGSFTKKKYKEMIRLMNFENSMQIARSSVSNILIDNNAQNVDYAIKWLHSLCVPPFEKDPDNPDRKIGKLENYFSILYYTKGIYIRETVSQDNFLCTMKALARVYPDMQIASSKGHSGKYETRLRNDDKRRSEILSKIRVICNDNSPSSISPI